MVWRLLLGPILIVALAAIFYLDALCGRLALPLLALCVLLSVRSAWELCELLRVRSFEPQRTLVICCVVAILISNWFERVLHSSEDLYVWQVAALGPAMLMFTLSFLVLLLSEAIRFQQPGKSMESLGAELLILSYAGILLSFTAQLRWVAGSDAGYLALGSLVVAAKAGDTGGYFLGKFLGRRKLIERLSPGKTWMGAFGALAGASLGSLAWFRWGSPCFYPGQTACAWYWALFFGLVIGMVGLVGDLCESLIKRDLGKKDSAALLPGFGGLLDLLDSVIYAAPVAYVLWLVLPLGPPQS